MPATLPVYDPALWEYVTVQRLGTVGPGQNNLVRRIRRKSGGGSGNRLLSPVNGNTLLSPVNGNYLTKP